MWGLRPRSADRWVKNPSTSTSTLGGWLTHVVRLHSSGRPSIHSARSARARSVYAAYRSRFPRTRSGRGGHDAEVHVHRLVVRSCRGPSRRRPARRARLSAAAPRVGRRDQVGDDVQRREQPGGSGLEVALGAGDLSGEPHMPMLSQAKRRLEQPRRVDERVAVHDAVSEELGLAEAGDHAEHAALLGEGEVRLEAHEVVRRRRSAFSGRSWTTAHGRCPVRGSVRPTGFRGPNRSASRPVRAISSTGWHAANSSSPLEVLRVHALGAEQRVDERLVLVAVHGGVQVVRSPALAVSRGGEDDVAVDRVRVDDRRGRVVEGQALAGQLVRGRASNAGLVSGPVATMHRPAGSCVGLCMRRPRSAGATRPARSARSEPLAVDREGRSGGHRRLARDSHDDAAQRLELALELARGCGRVVALERVRADQLAEVTPCGARA